MTRVCFIGNSHLAAIKLGWDEVAADWPGLDVSFFGAAGGSMEYLAAIGDRLQAVDERLSSKLEVLWKRTEIRPNDYDVICVHGMGAGVRTLFSLYPAFRSDAHRNTQGRFQLLSNQCFKYAATGLVRATLAARICALIQQTTDRPVFIIEQPALSAEAWSDQKGQWVKEAIASGDGEALLALFRSCLADLPGVSRVVPQPESTKANPLATKREYSAGSVKLNNSVSEAHDTGDNLHMNATYGAAVFAELSPILKSVSEARASLSALAS